MIASVVDTIVADAEAKRRRSEEADKAKADKAKAAQAADELKVDPEALANIMAAFTSESGASIEENVEQESNNLMGLLSEFTGENEEKQVQFILARVSI